MPRKNKSTELCSCGKPAITIPTSVVCPHCGSKDLTYRFGRITCLTCSCSGPKGICKCCAINSYAKHARDREDYLAEEHATAEYRDNKQSCTITCLRN